MNVVTTDSPVGRAIMGRKVAKPSRWNAQQAELPIRIHFNQQ
jgi:transcription elongation GreA/GreB family factor